MSKLPVSVCMISGAEAARIGRALESVVDWAGEIIVVLNEDARDGTEELAAKYGAKVFREPWQGFIRQKNSAWQKAAQPWLFGLDADEVVPPELRAEITDILAAAAPAHTAYTFPRRTFFCGRWIRHGEWYPDRVTRLCRRGSAAWAGIDPHAMLKVSGTIGRLRSDLWHFPNETIDGRLAKIISYSGDFLRHAQATGRPVTWLDLAFRPPLRFLKSYFLRLGFLDGWPGYYIAWMSAFDVVTRYAKVREARQSAPETKILPGG
jgi:glycosyltransferase involved in cell wall biosynthesis